MPNRKVSHKVSFTPENAPVIIEDDEGRVEVQPYVYVAPTLPSTPGSPVLSGVGTGTTATTTANPGSNSNLRRRISSKISFSSLTPPSIVLGTDGRFQISAVAPDADEYSNAKVVSPRESSSEEEDDEIGVFGSTHTSFESSRYGRTLHQFTEVLPRYEQYQEMDGVSRPGMEELYLGVKKVQEEQGVDEPQDKPVLKGKVVKFTWLEGVLMRCLLNIWGVMLFIRLSWVIGQAGVLEGLLAISWANITTLITAISMSAVASNGQIKGGGIYFMISRSLGPEFGGAIGLLFTAANSIAVALHIVGFCESLNDLMAVNDWGTIVDGAENDTRIIGAGVLVFILILAWVGMEWVTRTQMLMLVILVAAQINFMVGSFIGPVNDEEKAKGFVGYNLTLLEENLWSSYSKGVGKDDKIHDFFSVFGVFFPAVTGIVAGANLSGDLKDPATAIPKGTLLAIIITYVGYITYGVMMGACTLREASGVVIIDNFTNAVEFGACEGVDCAYGLLRNYQVMELISSWGPLIYMGCFAASLSSAIASLVGAPRVLQALAKDKLYPKIDFFAQGYGANNDPVRGYVLVFFIAMGCVLIANLNALAPLLSNIFLTAYCLINFSCFHATITKSPGWRPAFKYYNAWVSLVGSGLCIAAMFLMNWIMALITLSITFALYMYLQYFKPEDINWGSSTQASAFNSTLKSVLDLNSVHEHTKNYRPQILVLSGFPSSRPALVDFGRLIVKDISLVVNAHVVRGPIHGALRKTLTQYANEWLMTHKNKSFYNMTEGQTLQDGVGSLIQNVGLGKLRPNMVLLGYKNDWAISDALEIVDYYGVINQIFKAHLSIGILRVKEGRMDYSNVIQDAGQSTLNTHNVEAPSNAKEDEKKTDEQTTAPNSVPTVVHSNEKKKLKKSRKISVSAKFNWKADAPPSREMTEAITQFRRKQAGVIDVWWLYDDGGLTLLIPYLLMLRSQYSKCKLRIFTLCSSAQSLGAEQRSMALLLAKLRIDYSDIVVIPDVTKKASESTRKFFDDIIGPFKSNASDDPNCYVTDETLKALWDRTNRHLRLRELLQEHSKDSTLIIMTMLVPRRSAVPAPLYLAWLEVLTQGMPNFLLVRGNQESVLTFYA